ncbi:MAG: YcxB family protein [Sphingobacteriales bacterium]|nr:MAG: YcxB family protein [Sphingobacteriales bacterium]
MQIEFSYTKNEVIQALRYHFITRREIKFMIVLVNVFAILSAVLFFTHIIRFFPFFLSTILWIVLMFAFRVFLPVSIYKKAETFQDHFKVNLDENHFYMENKKGNRIWAWREFSEFLESPYFFHLYFDKRSFFLVPKSAFSNIQQLQEARELLKKHIGK